MKVRKEKEVLKKVRKETEEVFKKVRKEKKCI
jgi:hypothetical protein